MSGATLNPVTIPRELALNLLRDMVRIRRFEERCADLYGQQKIRGFLHLYIGEEAVAVGAIHALRPEDAIVATYREHGHALARGISANAIMAEMYGKREGCSRGRGGSMHIFDSAARLYGGNAIVGGGLPLAVGLALADKMQGRPHVTAAFFGEGAVAEGAFHESMNLAALWKLPVAFFCENNLYAMGTALARSESQTDLCAKAAAFKVPTLKVDGMDVVAVFEAAKQARGLRAGRRGSLLRGVPDLPLSCPLDVRSRAVSRQGGSGRVEKARADPQPDQPPQGRGQAHGRSRSSRSTPKRRRRWRRQSPFPRALPGSPSKT